jgi:hypothetical protein
MTNDEASTTRGRSWARAKQSRNDARDRARMRGRERYAQATSEGRGEARFSKYGPVTFKRLSSIAAGMSPRGWTKMRFERPDNLNSFPEAAP